MSFEIDSLASPDLAKPEKFKNKNSSSAFSLVEVLISVFLLSVGMLAAMSLLSVGLKEAMSSRDQMTAVFLAQEGVELMRNIRDENLINGVAVFNNWKEWMCARIDFNDEAIENDVNLRLKLKNGWYDHGSGDNTKFFRAIAVQNITNTSNDNDKGARNVISMVMWDGSGDKMGTYLPNDLASCTTANKCVYVESVLDSFAD